VVACDDVDFSAAPVSPVALDNAKPLLFDDEARGVLPRYPERASIGTC